MVRQTSVGLILTVAVLYLPWSLALVAIAASTIFFTAPLVPLALALFFDFNYGAVSAWPVGLAAVALAAILNWLTRRLIRLT